MALVKTDYNLIYNTDGSLCTTIREDDVPFSGVKSFAVEEGTENLAADGSFETSMCDFVQCGVLEVMERTTQYALFGDYSLRMYDSAGGLNRYIRWRFYDIVEGETVTVSVYVKKTVQATGGRIRLIFRDSNNTLLDASAIDFGQGPFDWKRFVLSGTAPANTDYVEILISTDGSSTAQEYFIDGFQVEKKPFATSFVDGTRPNGRLSFSLQMPDNFVVSFMGKPLPTGSTSSNYLFAWYADVNNKIGIPHYQNGIVAIEHRRNSVSQVVETVKNYPPDTWYHYVLLYEAQTLKLYINGELAAQMTLNDAPGDYSMISFQNATAFPLANALIANLYIGKAKDDLGNLIWTDEYIQELYNARKPFKLPANIPVK